MSDIDTAWQRSKSVSFLRNEKQETHPIRQMILRNAVGDTVLDVGCASSIDYVMWTRANYNYTGLDFTDKFMEYAKSLYPSIIQIKCDAGDMTVPDLSYDTVYCFSKDTIISGIQKQIQNIEVGDIVFGKDGKPQKVVKKYKRKYVGEMTEMKVLGLPPILVTSNHPILTTQFKRVHRKNNKSYEKSEYELVLGASNRGHFVYAIRATD